jgi:dipeptidyl-peptidase-4
MNIRLRQPFVLLLATALALTTATRAAAQDRLPFMPGYDRYQEMAPQMRGAMVSGALNVTWADDSRTFDYVWQGRPYRYDVAQRRADLLPEEPASPEGRSGRRGGPARGRQYTSADSPDGTLRAFYRDRNLYISAPDGSNEIAVTTAGDEEARTKFGTASWVYGEELSQNTAIWWSPDGSKLAYYGFDESQVLDFYLEMDQTQIQSSLDVEAYPKAGAPNPVVDLFVYDMASGTSTSMDVRDGQPFTNDVVGHYVYRIEWSPDGSELLIHRTNRRQNILEFAACDPGTGSCRVIVREEWLASWVNNRPPMQYLSDGHRFLWISERTGWRNLYLYDLSGELLATLTDHDFEVANVLKVDEDAGVVWYMARDGQLHEAPAPPGGAGRHQ